jgi:predicted Fe-S protein YdhL (DUF1289 family)
MDREGGRTTGEPERSESPGGVQSPCVRNCCLDEDDVCLGCGRSLQEILRWNEAGDEERRTVLENCRRRLEARAAKRIWGWDR